MIILEGIKRILWQKRNTAVPVGRLFLSGLVLSGGVGAVNQTPSAGRVWSIGDTLNRDVVQALQIPVSESSKYPVYWLVIFTRDNQRFSDRLRVAVSQLLEPSGKDNLKVVEVRHETQPPTQAREGPMPWMVIRDTTNRLAEWMGIRVFPTTYFLSGNHEILSYLPGYTPSSMVRLKEMLHQYLPDQFPAVESVHYSGADKHRIRLEKLAQKLYEKGAYDQVLEHLSQLDILSTTGLILKGYTYFRLEDYPRAKTVFDELLKSAGTQDYARLGLALIAYNQGYYEQSLELLNGIQSFPQLYRLYYWRGRVQEKLGHPDQAIAAYRRSAEYALQELPQTLIP